MTFPYTDYDTVGRPIITLRDRAESLLSCRVPNLDFHPFSIDANCFHREIHTNCIAMPLDIVARFETLDDACFPSATITNQHHFEQEIECIIGGRQLHQRGRIAACHCCGDGGGDRDVCCMCLAGWSILVGSRKSWWPRRAF